MGNLGSALKDIAHLRALFIAYSRERAWKAVRGRLPGPCYLSRADHDRKISPAKKEEILEILFCK
jgi:hypothetical protein